MRSGFGPHDRDRTTESMEGSFLGFGPLWKGCWAAKRRRLGLGGEFIREFQGERHIYSFWELGESK